MAHNVKLTSTQHRGTTHGVSGVGAAMLLVKERRPFGEHVLLRTGVGRRTTIYSTTGRLDLDLLSTTTAQRAWGDCRGGTCVGVQLERGGADRTGNRGGGAGVAVRCDCSRRAPVLTAWNCL